MDGSCDPNNANYEVGFDPVTNRIDCSFNNNDCAINSCKCDEKLAHGLNAAIDNINLDFVTNSDGTGFDHANKCKASANQNSGGASGTGDFETQCCGDYPDRFTFSTKNNNSCCGNVTYNTDKHDCCSNSFLAAIGECS